ncbi:glutamine-hydrolyzing GMP synthase [Candidatus Curtissbacteria bacterium]|nr:glutamine-hydrolyzing GMP synthase [Candidatus Curtissbacteria bacterium]
MVAVFNFGGQYAHLIARRVRELGVKSELVSPEIKPADLARLKPQALIFSGSPFSAYEKNAPKADPRVYKLDLPILGICYGHQLLAHQLGGKVAPKTKKQFGKEAVEVGKSPLFAGLAKQQIVWFSHGDQVEKMPGDFEVIGSTPNAKVAAMQNLKKGFFGIQFHPEVTHTPNGAKIISNFLFKISKAKRDWDLGKIKKEIVKKIKEKIKNEKVIMAISGGVDSLVAAVLLKEAGINLYLTFIDHGLLRKDENAQVEDIVKTVGFGNFRRVDASADFLRVLKRVVDPEKKRKIIAKLYFEIFEKEAAIIGDVVFLAQGTIYPDRIESAKTSKHADKIKSHHNVTLPHGLKLKIIEPLADLYKDEVRKLGRILKIPEKFLNRHPFPGPGLAIRILGEVTKDRLEILRQVDEIFISELKSNNIYKEVNQAFAALLPVKSVGVMGDARTYSYIIALRSVDTQDFMTADWSKISHQVLERISSRIVNEVRGVNRVVYDITQKPPATIEYE